MTVQLSENKISIETNVYTFPQNDIIEGLGRMESAAQRRPELLNYRDILTGMDLTIGAGETRVLNLVNSTETVYVSGTGSSQIPEYDQAPSDDAVEITDAPSGSSLITFSAEDHLQVNLFGYIWGYIPRPDPYGEITAVSSNPIVGRYQLSGADLRIFFDMTSSLPSYSFDNAIWRLEVKSGDVYVAINLIPRSIAANTLNGDEAYVAIFNSTEIPNTFTATGKFAVASSSCMLTKFFSMESQNRQITIFNPHSTAVKFRLSIVDTGHYDLINYVSPKDQETTT